MAEGWASCCAADRPADSVARRRAERAFMLPAVVFEVAV